MNIPITMNGIPIPIEYARSRLNAAPGVIEAKVSIEPRIGPTHGVHPAANARPKIKDNGKLVPVRDGKIFFSKFNLRIFELDTINMPNDIIIIPPIWLKLEINSFADEVYTELIATPNAEKTNENPRTKNIVFKITLVLFIETVCVVSDLVKSEIVVPEIYAKNAGIIGSIHGAKNDPTPAKIATKTVISDIS